jgi:hypothetical protein
MGHIRLGRLPATKKWQQVVALLAEGASVEQVAGTSAEAAESSLEHARHDPAVQQSFWLLTQIPIAARASDFPVSLQKLDIEIGAAPSLLEIIGAFSEAIDRKSDRSGGRTDLGEMARAAAIESLATLVGSDLPSLFEPTPADVRLAIGKLAAPDHFARLARDFFARLTQRHLDYYLSRTLSDHVGPGRSLAGADDRLSFGAALEQHCREASRIVEAFAGGWFSKANFDGSLTPEKARSFVFIALRKISRELRRRRAPSA